MEIKIQTVEEVLLDQWKALRKAMDGVEFEMKRMSMEIPQSPSRVIREQSSPAQLADLNVTSNPTGVQAEGDKISRGGTLSLTEDACRAILDGITKQSATEWIRENTGFAPVGASVSTALRRLRDSGVLDETVKGGPGKAAEYRLKSTAMI